MTIDWFPIQCAVAAIITAAFLYAWTRPRLHIEHDPRIRVVSIRRVGARVWRSYAGMAGDILVDREASGAVVGITMTEMQRYYDDPRAFDRHRDRALFPSYLWRAMRKWIETEANGARAIATALDSRDTATRST